MIDPAKAAEIYRELGIKRKSRFTIDEHRRIAEEVSREHQRWSQLLSKGWPKRLDKASRARYRVWRIMTEINDLRKDLDGLLASEYPQEYDPEIYRVQKVETQ